MTILNTETKSLLKLKEALAEVRVSRSTWYAGIKEGIYPPPVKIGKRAVAWRKADIEKLIHSFKSEL
mgnify:CR=1 FL=1